MKSCCLRKGEDPELIFRMLQLQTEKPFIHSYQTMTDSIITGGGGGGGGEEEEDQNAKCSLKRTWKQRMQGFIILENPSHIFLLT